MFDTPILLTAAVVLLAGIFIVLLVICADVGAIRRMIASRVEDD